MIKKTSITIQNVSFAYDVDLILKNITIKLKPNRICFIMGNNGSGKTTLLKNITNFLIPQSGNIRINDLDITKTDKNTLSKYISYVPQAIHLNTDFSVFDYLSLGRTPYQKIVDSLDDEDFKIIDYYSSSLGIDELYSSTFNKLSGGQKQLVAIARSLIQDTPILVLDEPMSALDIGKQAELLKFLYELAENGKTIVMTTHNPNHALTIDSDSCFIQNGEVIAFGNSKDVLNDKLLNKVYGPNIALDPGIKYPSIVFKKEEV